MIEQAKFKNDSVWLASDERKLLAHYYKRVHNLSDRETFETHELAAVLSDKPAQALRKYETLTSLQEYEKSLDDYPEKKKRIDIANDLLNQRGLIQLGGNKLIDSDDWVVVKLTPNGYSLGRKYNNSCWLIVFWCHKHIGSWFNSRSQLTNN